MSEGMSGVGVYGGKEERREGRREKGREGGRVEADKLRD